MFALCSRVVYERGGCNSMHVVCDRHRFQCGGQQLRLDCRVPRVCRGTVRDTAWINPVLPVYERVVQRSYHIRVHTVSDWNVRGRRRPYFVQDVPVRNDSTVAWFACMYAVWSRKLCEHAGPGVLCVRGRHLCGDDDGGGVHVVPRRNICNERGCDGVRAVCDG